MAQFTVKTRKTVPEEQVVEAETPEEAVEQLVVAAEEAGATIEILQVTPGAEQEPKAEAEAPAEAPAEEPTTA